MRAQSSPRIHLQLTPPSRSLSNCFPFASRPGSSSDSPSAQGDDDHVPLLRASWPSPPHDVEELNPADVPIELAPTPMAALLSGRRTPSPRESHQWAAAPSSDLMSDTCSCGPHFLRPRSGSLRAKRSEHVIELMAPLLPGRGSDSGTSDGSDAEQAREQRQRTRSARTATETEDVTRAKERARATRAAEAAETRAAEVAAVAAAEEEARAAQRAEDLEAGLRKLGAVSAAALRAGTLDTLRCSVRGLHDDECVAMFSLLLRAGSDLEAGNSRAPVQPTMSGGGAPTSTSRGPPMLIEGLADEAVARPVGASRLIYINMSHNRIADSGARALAAALAGGAPALASLIIHENLIGCDGAAALAHAMRPGAAPNLEVVRLSFNRIGDDGLCALAAAWADGGAVRLRQLDLHSNRIGDRGASALADALGHAPALTSLCLGSAVGGNVIGDAGALRLVQALRTLSGRELQLSLRSNPTLSPAGADALRAVARECGDSQLKLSLP